MTETMLQELPQRVQELDKKQVRNSILMFEDKLRQLDGSFEGKESEEVCPLEHDFVDGAYVRKIFMPKGTLLTSKIHKICHPYFIMSGECSVLTDEGIIRIKAPFSGITKAWTKRVLYIHEDTVWVTVHVTKHKDLEQIEDEIIAKDFSELDALPTEEQMKQLRGE